jgi:hypothetical protein
VIRRRLLRLAMAVFLIALAAGPRAQARDLATCATRSTPAYPLSGRVDTLVAAGSALIALVGGPSSTIRFLPHDNVVTFAGTGLHARAATIPLPPYIAAPGLAAYDDGRQAFALVDNALFVLGAPWRRITTRWTLDMQAVGWPAAIAADADRHLYIAGQPANAWAAQVEALALRGTAQPRVLWRASLGLTHAGIWLGLAGNGEIAVYLPSASDVHGTVALLNRQTGTLLRSYAVPAPPIAADPLHDRLFLADAGTIHALSLRNGQPIATAPGDPPLAVDPTRGLLAYVHAGGLVLADSRTLRSLAQLPIRDTTTLAFTGDGALLIGAHSGIIELDGAVGTPGACHRL